MSPRQNPNILSTVTNLLPVPLLLVSLITSILSATSKSWATQEKFQTADPEARVYIGTITRSLFKNCSLDPKTGANPLSSNPADYFLNCSLPRCDTKDPYDDQPYLCQQIHIAGNFLIAGIVFTGLAFLVSLVVLAVGFMGKRETGEKRRGTASKSRGALGSVLKAVLRLFMVLAVVLTAAANIIGAQQLINNQQYDGDFISTGGTINSTFGHWMVGKGTWLAFAGWICTLIGLTLLSSPTEGTVRENKRHYREEASIPVAD